MSARSTIATLPALPLRRASLFPRLIMPLTVARPSSVAAVEAALASEDKRIVVVAQREPQDDAPAFDGLFTIGTTAEIKQLGRGADGQLQVLVHGLERVAVVKVEQQTPYLTVRYREFPLPEDSGAEIDALRRAIMESVAALPKLMPSPGMNEAIAALGADADPVTLGYRVAAVLNLTVDREQQLLEAPTAVELLRRVYVELLREVQVLEIRNKIASDAQAEVGKTQREYYLRQQLKAIQDELGDEDDEEGELPALKRRIEEAQLPEAVRKEAERELARLSKLPPAAPDHQVIRSYLELVLELPWNKASADELDLARVRQVLDEDHYGIAEVKERIVEHLAVLQLNPQAKAPILCLVGPPGVGKTSLGQSIARALGRTFERFSLGGVHDEAELRGHRRTYIGAMPGRIIQTVRRAGVSNPVLMLDEVDKIGRDFRGDPAAVLLEVLDPAQNHTFRDHYLDLPFDLSKVFFITTANTLDPISPPLLDRMEIIRLPGYSEREKLEIAVRYLWPRRLREAGLDAEHVQLADDVIAEIISRYTREAGVRQLEQMLGRLTRKVAVQLAEAAGPTTPVVVEKSHLVEWLGTPRFMPEEARKQLPPGVATGLAWTPTGGDVLYVETTLLPGSHDVTLTGQLGDVMQESARAARSYLWSHADALGIEVMQFRRKGVHIHVPSGAIPKDGPSAGVTMAAALASAYLGTPVRVDTAMTGEVSLSGLVLPVGGIKEKVLAAHRAGIRRIVLPRANEKDLREVPEAVRADTEFVLVSTVDETLEAVLEPRQTSGRSHRRHAA